MPSSKLPKETVEQKIRHFEAELAGHIGQPAMLYIKPSRSVSAYFVYIIRKDNKFFGRVKVFENPYKFRWDYILIDPKNLVLETYKVVYLNDIEV